MERLLKLIGIEHALRDVCRALREFAAHSGAPVVGALEVTCSDESEHECIAAFQQGFVEPLLPDLKVGTKSPFRTSNLGARYEWGSVRVAEQHFATPATRGAFKLLVLKINGHVAVTESPEGPRFGPLARYDTESAACGALHALLRGDDLPALRELRELFSVDGLDRISALNDGSRIAARHRYLLAALVGARLQARRALEDVRVHVPQTPTLYLIVPAVTLNRSGPDTEIVIGVQMADFRGQKPEYTWHGLGHDPTRYRAETMEGRVVIRETGVG